MTLLIAHRGLIHGPDSTLENTPEQLLLARNLGYDVELDAWYADDTWWLGHDRPTHRVDFDFIERLGSDGQRHAWVHAKNINALFQLRMLEWPGHYFYHQNDDVVLTSTGYLWTYPGRQLTMMSICVMPEWVGMLETIQQFNVCGICSDYVGTLR